MKRKPHPIDALHAAEAELLKAERAGDGDEAARLRTIWNDLYREWSATRKASPQ